RGPSELAPGQAPSGSIGLERLSSFPVPSEEVTKVRKLALVVGVALGALVTAAPARAAIITFTDRTAFNAATTNQNTFDFSGVTALNNFAFFSSPPGFTRGGVNFQSSTNFLFVIGRDFSGGAFAFTGVDFVLQNNALNTSLNITLPGGTTAFAFDAG